MAEAKEIRPQPGPQEMFLSTSADIAIYGGGAGGGKSFGLLLEPLRHIYNPKFGAVIFRRTTKQVRNEGGLWSVSNDIYGALGATPLESTLKWKFQGGMTVQFAHLEFEKNVLDWQGAQIAMLGYDELTHFTEYQFFYLLSRNRSDSGVPGYIRATCNPDKNSWVRKFIAWWIDEETGYAIPERSGVLRWFVRIDDKIIWGDTREELIEQHPGTEEEPTLPKSVTFIPAKLEDNKILMKNDPSYAANLNALPRVERERLRGGNWNIEASSGEVFKKNWFEVVDAAPADCDEVRYWDRASTEVTDSTSNKDPDYTAGLKMLKSRSTGVHYIADVRRERLSPLGVERLVKNTATQDGIKTQIGVEQDPGSAGVADAGNYTRLLSGFVVRVFKPSQAKVTRALPASAQAEAGNIKLVRGDWNDDFLSEVENFPDDAHDDQVDALSGAFNMLNSENVGTFGDGKAKSQVPNKPFAGSIGARRPW